MLGDVQHVISGFKSLEVARLSNGQKAIVVKNDLLIHGGRVANALDKMGHYNKYRTKQLHTHIHLHTH